MANVKEHKKLVPYITPMLDGTYDCYYWLRQGAKERPMVVNKPSLNEAKIFCEDQECKMILEKIERWHNQRMHVINMPFENNLQHDYRNQVAMLNKMIAAVQKLHKNAANSKERMAFYVEKYFIEWLEYCAPGKKSKYYAYTQKLITELRDWSESVTTPKWEPIV